MIDKFRAKFVEESLDNVRDMEEALFLLEGDPKNREIIERIFRAMHSLKGGGAMFGFNDLSEFTHHLETVFDWVRNGKLDVSKDLISLTFSSIDEIKFLLGTGDLTDEADKIELRAVTSKVKGFLNASGKAVAQASGSSIGAATSTIDETKTSSKTYAINFTPNEDILQNGTNTLFLLDDLNGMGEYLVLADLTNIPSFESLNPTSHHTAWQCFLNSEESLNDIKDVFIFVEDECVLEIIELSNGNILESENFLELFNQHKLSGTIFDNDQLETLKQVAPVVAPIVDSDAVLERAAQKAHLKESKISSIRVASKKVDELVNLVSELVTIQAQLSLYAEKSGDPAILGLTESVQKLSRQLRENAFEISLMPLQAELLRFQRLVRDLSKDLNKQIDFDIEGGDIELDKNIIEHLTDPLLHMIRNSIDHGIENPDERVKKGKQANGTISFKAYYSGPSVIIKLKDDGKGIDTEYIRNKAISKGLIDSKAQLSKKEIFELLLLSGFSTKEVVSDLSGRGVGMDVVKRKISEIRGEVSIDSVVNEGTTITLELPMTLSIIDGLLVNVAASQYVLPISIIEKIFAVKVDELKVSNNVVVLDNQQFQYIRLRDVFNEEEHITGHEHIVIVKNDDKKVALLVDNIMGEFQVVVKPLGKILKSQDVVSGASIMGDGSISLVIDSHRLVQFFNFNIARSKK